MAAMSFADDVKAETRSTGTVCKVCRIIGQIDPKERPEVEMVMADPNFVAEAIARAMARRGWEVSGNVIRNHRRKCISSK